MGLRLLCRKGIGGMKCSGGHVRMMSSDASPWLMLPPAAGGYKFYSPASKKVMRLKKEKEMAMPSADGLVRLVGSSHGWLATFNAKKQHIFVSDPISSRQMKLPDIHTLPEVSCRERPTVVKLILTCSDPTGDECRAVMIMGVSSGMALCCPGAATSSNWTWFAHNTFYKDFVYSTRHNRLFCITGPLDDKVECWDLRDPTSPTRDWVLNLNLFRDDDLQTKSMDEADLMDAFSRDVRYLVFAEHSDRLFLVIRYIFEEAGPNGSYVKSIHFTDDRSFFFGGYPYRTFAFDVHEIDWKGKGRKSPCRRYVEDGSLNGLAMFVGNNHSFALDATTGFPELKPDSIYFTEEQEFTPYYDNDLNYGGHDNGVFNYLERNFSSLYYSSHASSFTRIIPPPIWFTPSNSTSASASY